MYFIILQHSFNHTAKTIRRKNAKLLRHKSSPYKWQKIRLNANNNPHEHKWPLIGVVPHDRFHYHKFPIPLPSVRQIQSSRVSLVGAGGLTWILVFGVPRRIAGTLARLRLVFSVSPWPVNVTRGTLCPAA